MLKQRVLTAVILIPLALALIFLASPLVFCVVTGLISLWGIWEWSAFLVPARKSHRLVYTIVSAVLMLMALFEFSPSILLVSFIWWLIALGLIIVYPRFSQAWGKGNFWRALMGWLVIIPCWITLNFMRNVPQGPWMVLYLFVLIWGADSAAYFAGKKWGTRPLAPRVSPGKTWQGLMGALVCGLVITAIEFMLLHLPVRLWAWGMGLALITVLFSVVGDLFESMMKRQAGVKDSGSILPGHGGLLDRIDSLTAAVPVFALGALILGRVVS